MTALVNLLRRPVVTMILLALPVILFFAYFFYLRYDIPWFDEYEIFPYFLQQFLDAPTLAARWQALVKPVNEHRLLYAHLVLLLQHGLTGGINFADLMLVGNLGLVAILALFGRVLRDRGQSLVYLLPVPLWLFTTQNFLLTFTAAYTLQYLAIILLAFLTLYALVGRHPAAYAGAVVLGLISTFSMGNGLLVWPAGAVLLLSQRRWPALAGWLAVGAFGIWAYFYGYPVQQGNAEGFAFVQTHPGQTLAGFLIYCGSWLDAIPNLPIGQRVMLPFVGGVLLLAGLGFWAIKLLVSRKSASPTDAFLLGAAVFLLASMALIALFRIRFGFELVLWPSYRTYALVLWPVAYLILIQTVAEKYRPRLLPVLYGLTLLIALLSVADFLPEALERRRLMQSLTFNQRHNRIGLGGSREPSGMALTRWLDELTGMMATRGWYSLPNPAIATGDTLALQSAQAVTERRPITLSLDSVAVHMQADWSVPPFGKNDGTFMLIQSDRHTYVTAAVRRPPISRNPYRPGPGFTANLPVGIVDRGHYRVGVLTVTDDKSTVAWTDRFVDVP